MSGKMAEYMAVSVVARASRDCVLIHAKSAPWRRLLLPPRLEFARIGRMLVG